MGSGAAQVPFRDLACGVCDISLVFAGGDVFLTGEQYDSIGAVSATCLP